MSQTAYTQDPAVAIEGMLADASFAKEVLSAIADEAIAFGRAIARTTGGPADDRPPRAVLPTTAAEITTGVFLGISRADTTLEQAATPVGYAVDTTIGYLRKGRIWVLTEEAVALGDPVFARFAAGAGGSILGLFRNDADTASAAQIPGASFRSAVGAAGLAIVELTGQI